MSRNFLANKKMKKLILTCLITFCIVSVSFAQDYNTGIGLRAGFYNGLTVKHFISQKIALEGLLSSRWRGFEITGLYEIHNQAFNTDRLNWYIGFGGHVGFWGDGGGTLHSLHFLNNNNVRIFNREVCWFPGFSNSAKPLLQL